jgi:hypothetical protein
MTRFKLTLINIIIAIGAIAIGVLQWPHAMKNVGEADDVVGVILLEVLIAGIPIILWAAAAHYVLTWALMRRGELDDYHAQQEIARLGPQAEAEEGPEQPQRTMLD